MAGPEILRLDPDAPDAGGVSRVAARLRAGDLVALPTDTVYGVCADAASPPGLQRLRALKARAGKPFALLLADGSMALRYAAALPPLALRFASAFWPGPLTLVLPARTGGTVGLRVPGPAATRRILEALNGAAAASSANLAGGAEPADAGAVVASLGESVSLVVDAGPARFGRASTVVQVEGDGYAVLREGALPRAELAEQAHVFVLFVCTGNTCRSPMAEGLLKRLLADRLGVLPEDLRARGFRVESAGTGGFGGGAASGHALAALAEAGAPLDGHRSKAVSASLVEEADRVFVMTEGHRRTILDFAPAAAGRVQLVDPGGGPVDDPVGGDLGDYRRTRDRLQGFLERRLADILALGDRSRTP